MFNFVYSAQAVGLAGILVSVVWAVFYRAVPIENSKDRVMYCILNGATMYLFASLLALAVYDPSLLQHVLQNQYGSTELMIAFFAAMYEAFTALIRIFRNISTIEG